MTGLNLETFLQLLRVAPGAWASLGVALMILALMTWTSWGSRRALRKCLFLSIAAHFALIFYGGSSPEIQRYFRLGSKPPKPAPVIERIKVTSFLDPARTKLDPAMTEKPSLRPVSAWDRDSGSLAMANGNRPLSRPDRPEPPQAPQPEPPKAAESTLPPGTAPEMTSPDPSAPELTPKVADPAKSPEPVAEAIAPGEGVALPVSEPFARGGRIVEPTSCGRKRQSAIEVASAG